MKVSPESRVGLKFQNEKFIFYRGFGKFTTDLKITSGSNPEKEGHDGGITLSNHSMSPIPEAFLLRITPESGSSSALGALHSAQ
ncbi:MAG: hypothetical protein H7222_06290 [Methylotenera sp.]|nr:hypothetical protein [Oligoflexia bacterium]